MKSLKVFGLVVVVAGSSLALNASRAASAEQDLLAYLPLTHDLLEHSPHQLAVRVIGKVEVVNGAASFPGDQSWLELPHLALNKTPFTLSMWIKVTGQEPMYGLIEQRDSNVPNKHFHVMLRGALQPWLGFCVNDVVSPSSLAAGEWTHLVFQYNGTHQLIWVNGRLLCERRAKAYAGATGVTCLGKNPNWKNVPARHFEGQMREVRIYGRAVSAEEIASLHAHGGGTAPVPPAATAGKPAPGAVVRATASAVVFVRTAPFLSIEGNRLTINGAAGEVYELQATSNILGPWQPLATLTNAAGALHFIDTDAVNASERFYRIAVK